MKKAILATILMLAIYSCGSSKKTTTSAEKTVKDTTGQYDSIHKLQTIIKNYEKTIRELTKTKNVTDINYKPSVDPNTGKLQPFNYEEKRNGKPVKSINISGNGEVNIHSEEESLREEVEHQKDSIKTLDEQYKAELKGKSTEISELEKIVKEKSAGVGRFWLWLIIVVLAALLLISIIFHIKRTGLPFINKK